ncbi:hypothetical protein BM526_19390 (plasmid) [Alteromonas mediterranea]|uniref:hypothetical protein n=1 Tax=Alteromonas mediterranea TaxID=314275 RepID=UPI00090450D3|nr:hypothetical protein [Alteromonas mediterranea]APE04134.1 hypothetical protein BM526_19390 [Alteromonas mediterranea]
MKVALWILIGLVITAFAKGIFDINLAIENGESAKSVLKGSIPMYLLGSIALTFLGLILKKISNDEISEFIQAQTTEESSNE